MKKSRVNILEDPIIKVLAKLTWPMIFGMLGMVVFNLVDTFFIGKVGVEELAAIGFTFPVIMFISSISMGIGIGTSSLISRTFVSEEKKTVRQYAAEALLLAVILILIFVFIGLNTIDPIFKLIGANDKMLPLIHEYMDIWYWGMIFVVIPMVGNNIIRATGDTFTPGMIMLISAIVNIIIDPILIFGLGPFPVMGLKGAAIATVIGRAVAFLLAMYVLIVREKLITYKIPNFRHLFNTWKKVLFIAGPASVGMLITPVSIAVITKIISKFGEEAIAAFGIVSRIEMFALLVVHALASVMIIFAGQNWAKKKFIRLNYGINISSVFSVMWGALLFVICLFASENIAGIFSDNSNVINIISEYLIIVSFSYSFQGILMIGITVFNGINKPLRSASLLAIRMLVLYIPLAYFASKYFGLSGIFWAAFIANTIVGIISYISLKIVLKKNIALNKSK
ncbi:MAG: MATE family efflux transporter [Bacteroidales bacterium]|jgi:putative MATE family efflux protein|nr:MATE family efflux transporter [Bacteroidales bacterium]